MNIKFFMKKNIFSHRRTLLPYLVKKLKAKSYLEIGVKGGKTFLPIKVRKKYAVDPDFKIKKEYKKKQILAYPFNYFAKYFECTSNDFFEKHAPQTLKKNALDVAFIDGLHTYEQTYLDIENTLPYVKENGVIIVHDCSPASAAAAYPATSIQNVKEINPPGFDGLWSGDVWKIIPRLKLSHPELFLFVIDHDSGIGVISKSNLFNRDFFLDSVQMNYTIEDIKAWDYDYFAQNKFSLMNIIKDEKLIKACHLFK